MSIEMMIDMLENRLSDMVVTDREDAKEQIMLKRAIQELAGMSLNQARTMRRRSSAPLRRPEHIMMPVEAL